MSGPGLLRNNDKIGSLTRYLENRLTDWVDTSHSEARVSVEAY